MELTNHHGGKFLYSPDLRRSIAKRKVQKTHAYIHCLVQAICMPVRKACSMLTFELQDQHSYTQQGKIKNLHTTIQQVRLFHSNWAACKKTRSCPNISNNKITTRLFFLWPIHYPPPPPPQKTNKQTCITCVCKIIFGYQNTEQQNLEFKFPHPRD